MMLCISHATPRLLLASFHFGHQRDKRAWVRSSNLSSRVYVSIFLRKKGRRNLILHGGSSISISIS